MRAAWLILLVSLFAWPLFTWPLAAQAPAPAARPADSARPVAGRLADWLHTLDSFAAALTGGETPTAELVAMRPVLDGMRGAAETAKLRLRALAAEKQGLLDALGPAPADGAPEAMAITAQRGQLTTELAADLDQLKQLDLVTARSQALIDRIDKVQQQRLAQELGHRGASPFDGGTWSAAAPQFVDMASRLITAPAEWTTNVFLEHRRRLASLALSWIAFAAIVTAATLGSRVLRRRFGRPRATEPPGRGALYLGALIDMLVKTALPIVLMHAGIALLRSQGLAFGLFGALVSGAVQAASIVMLYLGLVDLVISPSRPAWRLYPLMPAGARRVRRRVRLLAALLFVALWLQYGFGDDNIFGHELESLILSAIGLVLAGIMFGLTDPQLWHRDDPVDDKPISGLGLFLLWVLRVLIIVGALAILLGFQPFARFVLAAALQSYALLFAYSATRHIGREAIGTLTTSHRPGLVWLRRSLGFAEDMRIARLWFGWLLDCILFIGAAIWLLLFWGVPGPIIFDRLRELLFGFSVGDIKLSLVDVLAAICVVVLFVLVTNAVKRWLQETVMPQTRLDLGVQNSITAGTGYVGYVVAAIIGFSALGLNLSNIAIIAGALSVGIGFGLQNIVNNFVSGLILLIERPIKVGDWVVVGNTEGVVRSISVRATEVETFRRASLIIPNSEFISKQVMNWTHRSKQGRADVRLTVAYGSDVETVRETLLRIYRDHPDIVAYPAPTVLFEDFGDNALVFSARGFVDDVDRRSVIESELRFIIYKAFASAGIQTPSGPTVTILRQEKPGEAT
jgi:small-conductance mechanosensitive channel